jgi:hypothetical protein
MSKKEALLNTLKEGVERLQREGVDRCVVHVQEMDGIIDKCGLIVRNAHYPSELLTPDEKAFEDKKESYATFSLITGDMGGGLSHFTGPYVEQVRRARIAENIYQPLGKTDFENKYDSMDCEEFAKVMAEAGVSPKELTEWIDGGIRQYHAKTAELNENAGVYESLKRLEGYMPIVPITSLNENMMHSVVHVSKDAPYIV